MHVYEVRPRKDRRGVDLLSDALPFGRMGSGKSNYVVTVAVRRAVQVATILGGMKPTVKAAARSFIICRISMIAASTICSRSLSTNLKTIRTLVLAIMFAASVVANANAGLHTVPSPQIDGQLSATAVIADNDIWAVGFSDQVPAPPVVDSTLAEHFDGTSWSIIPTPPLPSGNAQFLGVAGAASNDVWAVGLSPSGALVEHFDGTSWSVVSSPAFTGVSVAAISADASNDVWVVGGNGSNAGVEHWDGTSWSIISSPAFTGVSLNAVSADASNDVWAVGVASTIFGAPFSGPAVLHFDGTSWSLINPNTSLDSVSVTALSPTNVWAVGTVFVFFNHRTHRKAAIEHWDGTSWSIVPSPDPTHSPGLDSFLSGIAAISASDVWAVGFNFINLGGWDTLTEHWDGTSWKIIGSSNPGNFKDALFGVSTLSDGTVAAVGFQQDQGFDAMALIMKK